MALLPIIELVHLTFNNEVLFWIIVLEIRESLIIVFSPIETKGPISELIIFTPLAIKQGCIIFVVINKSFFREKIFSILFNI